MKRFLYSFTVVVSMILFFSLCYYVSFRNTAGKLESEKNQQTEEFAGISAIVPETVTAEPETAAHESATNENMVSGKMAEVSAEDDIITSDTVCVYELYYLDTGEQLRYESSPTSEIAGLTRKQLQDKLDEYIRQMSIMEFEEGLISYELVSFSPQKVVMRKVYDGEKVKYKYYVSVRNNEVIVFYSDKKTVFEYTGISCEDFQDNTVAALEIGIPVKDLEELYDYLSGITS